MTLLLISTVVLFITPIIIFCIKKKTFPNAISNLYYYLEEIKKGLGILFTLWIFAIALMILPVALEALEGKDHQFLALFASFFLALVGAAPRFKTTQRAIHNMGAYGSAVVATLIIYFSGYIWILLPLIFTAYIIDKKTKESDTIFWMEDAFFISYFALFFFI